jgi:hypothetical protein
VSTFYPFQIRITANPLRVVLLNYREDGVTPYVVVWKHGLKEMKV